MKTTLADLNPKKGEWYTVRGNNSVPRMVVIIDEEHPNLAQIPSGHHTGIANLVEPSLVSENTARFFLTKEIIDVQTKLKSLSGIEMERLEDVLENMKDFYKKHFPKSPLNLAV